MAKTPKPTRKVYIATRTIHAGTPKRPEIIPRGEEVELSAEEIKALLASGAIREETVKGGKTEADGDGGGDQSGAGSGAGQSGGQQ